nr:hypothetical protein [Tanacetum cinerariifolium]
MATLRYRVEHNKVGYLLKPTGSNDYHQIIDFLRASHIRTPELGPPAIQATIDKTPYTITKDIVRSHLQLADDGGIDELPIAEIYSIMDNLSTKSGSWDQFGSPIDVALICLSDGRRFNWSSYIFKGMVSNIGNAKNFLMLDFEGHPMPLLPAMLLQAQAGGAKDPITLTALSSVVSTLVQKINSLETELKDHKKLFKDVVGKLVKKVKAMKVKLKTKKRKMVVSDSDQEDGRKRDVDLDALRALANAAVTVDYNIPLGGASYIPAVSTSVHAAVPTDASTVFAGSPSVSADVPPSMQEDILGEQAAKRLHIEEQAQLDIHRAELSKKNTKCVSAANEELTAAKHKLMMLSNVDAARLKLKLFKNAAAVAHAK